MNWMDDYLSWVTTANSDTSAIPVHCCRFYTNTTTFCPHPVNGEDGAICEDCFKKSEDQPLPICQTQNALEGAKTKYI